MGNKTNHDSIKNFNVKQLELPFENNKRKFAIPMVSSYVTFYSTSDDVTVCSSRVIMYEDNSYTYSYG